MSSIDFGTCYYCTVLQQDRVPNAAYCESTRKLCGAREGCPQRQGLTAAAVFCIVSF